MLLFTLPLLNFLNHIVIFDSPFFDVNQPASVIATACLPTPRFCQFLRLASLWIDQSIWRSCSVGTEVPFALTAREWDGDSAIRKTSFVGSGQLAMTQCNSASLPSLELSLRKHMTWVWKTLQCGHRALFVLSN